MRLFTLLLFLTPTLSIFPLHAASRASQSTIDSLVDRAYYILTSVDDPGSGMSREKAIVSAKGMIAQLHALAEGDPNRSYILGKTKELEGQIYLEQKGLLLETDQFRQKNLNDRIVAFNKELGKRRPSLRQLFLFKEQITAIDPKTGIQVEKSIRKRSTALAQEVPAALKLTLEKGLVDSARCELVYCETNRDELGLSAARYAELEAKVTARINSEDERTLVRKSLDGFKVALANNDLTVARRENGFTSRRIRSLRGRLVPFEWNRLNGEFDLLSRKLNAKQDSLVGAALDVLRKSGPAAAERHLEAMKTAGVSPERIGQIDRAILETVIAQKQHEADRDTSHLAAVDDSGTAVFALQDMIASAKKRAAEKKDSTAAVAVLATRSTQVEEVRRNRLRIAYELQQIRSRDKKRTEKEQALQELVDIYRFLELQKSQDAYQKLLYVKALLQNNIPLEDYDKVTAAVERQYEKSKEK